MATETRGTVVFDLDGVVYLGSQTIPGSGSALREINDRGWQLLFATNNSSRTPAQVADKIHSLTGFAAAPDSVVTSGMAAASLLDGPDGRVLVVGEAGLLTTIAATGVEVVEDPDDADTVVVGIKFDVSYGDIKRAADAVRAGATFLATNTDAAYPTQHGLAPGAGSIVAAVSVAAEATAIDCGKPNAPMGDLVQQLVHGSDVWMIGDRPDTDIALAKRYGWHSVITLTGVTKATADVPPALAPDDSIASIRDLPALLGSRSTVDLSHRGG